MDPDFAAVEANDEANGDDIEGEETPEMLAMQAKVKEMEDEAEKLKSVQGQYESSANPDGTPGGGAI